MDWDPTIAAAGATSFRLPHEATSPIRVACRPLPFFPCATVGVPAGSWLLRISDSTGQPFQDCFPLRDTCGHSSAARPIPRSWARDRDIAGAISPSFGWPRLRGLGLSQSERGNSRTRVGWAANEHFPSDELSPPRGALQDIGPNRARTEAGSLAVVSRPVFQGWSGQPRTVSYRPWLKPVRTGIWLHPGADWRPRSARVQRLREGPS